MVQICHQNGDPSSGLSPSWRLAGVARSVTMSLMKDKYPNGLRDAMSRTKVGPTELAAAISSTKQSVQRWRDGERKLPIEMAEKMATALSTTVGELVLGARSGVQRVPLLDRISAGNLAAPTSQIPVEDVPLLAFADLGRGEFFALRVEGTSMDRVSPEGSLIVVNKADRQLVAGKPYVFWTPKEGATYKRWRPGDPSYLEPDSWDNSNKPIFIKKLKDLQVIGRVRRSFLDL